MVIDPPTPGKLPPNHHNRIPDLDQRRTTTTARPPVTQRRIFPIVPKPTTAITTTTTTTTTRPPLPPKRVTPAPRKPAVPTRKPFVPTRKPPAPTRKPYVPPRPSVPTRHPEVTSVDNAIEKEVTKQRGDVHSKTCLSLILIAFFFFTRLTELHALFFFLQKHLSSSVHWRVFTKHTGVNLHIFHPIPKSTVFYHENQIRSRWNYFKG